MTTLSLDGLGKRFGSFTALADVTADIPSGAFVCLLGPSGCGKTTLLRLIAGLEPPSDGRLLVGGTDQTHTPTHRRDFGMVFQSLALFPHLSVAENIAYPLTIRNVPRARRRQRTEELLELVRLPGMGARRIHQLSGGQRQRVAIARGLAIDPSVFLLDEPLSALDANLREHMQVELRELQQRLGVTTILVTHDQKEALTMADIVIVIKDGRVQQIGPPMEVYRNPANAFVAGFIGTSNLLACRLSAQGQHVTVAEREIALTPGDVVQAQPGGAAVLSIRPEDVELSPSVGDSDLPATVTFIRDLGESVQVSLDCGDHTLVATMPPRARPDAQVGAQVGLQFASGRRVVLAP